MATENLVERIKRLIAEAVRSGRFASEAQALKEAGISSGYLAELTKRIKRNPSASMVGPTARKLADALGVTVETILRGQSPGEPPIVDKYPERAWAITSARALKISEAAIQVVLREDPGTDPGRMYWFRRIEAEEQRASPPADSGSHKI